jgi:mycothiol synthase
VKTESSDTPRPPSPFIVKPASVDKQTQICELIAECDRVAGFPPTVDEAQLEDEWSGLHFNLVSDSWLVTTPHDEPVAYAQLWSMGPKTLVSFGVVHPAYRRLSLGSYLVDCVEHRAPRHPIYAPDLTLFSIVLPTESTALDLLIQRGYKKERSFFHMEMSLRNLATAPQIPGLVISAFDPISEPALFHSTMETGFQDHWDFSPTPFDEWWQEQTSRPSYDPTLWWIARINNEVAGAVDGSVGQDGLGYINGIAVLRKWRRRGIGAALLSHSFTELKKRGLERVALGVDSESLTGATRLYERQGMQVKVQFDLYGKSLGSSPSN